MGVVFLFNNFKYKMINYCNPKDNKVNKMVEFQIWAEKYRPKSLKDIINQKHVVERLKAWIKSGNIPNMLFAGPAGVGMDTGWEDGIGILDIRPLLMTDGE